MRLNSFFPESLLPELPVPPIPVEMEDSLTLITPNLLASSRLPAEPWNLNLWLTALEQFNIQDMMVYGIDGFGVNSHALHYYLIRPHLAVFLQYPFGGIYQEPANLEEVEEMMVRISALDCLIDDLTDTLFEAGDKLVVVHSGFAGTHLGVLDSKNQQISWLPVDAPLLDYVEIWLSEKMEA